MGNTGSTEVSQTFSTEEDIVRKYNEKITNNELDVECAALMIWINKHCFNGLYRVNNKGLFNVPYNNKQTGKSMDEVNLVNIGYYLSENKIDIRCQDFEELCEECKAGDFVYFDSPYLPESETAYFTDYTKDGFGKEDHERLAKLYRLLDSKGVMVMLSNNNVPLAHQLYEGFKSCKLFLNSMLYFPRKYIPTMVGMRRKAKTQFHMKSYFCLDDSLDADVFSGWDIDTVSN